MDQRTDTGEGDLEVWNNVGNFAVDYYNHITFNRTQL